MANVQEYKKKIVNDMTKLMRQYNIVGMVNMEDMPAPQLQSMRSELRGKVDLFMTKKRLMKIAIEKMKSEKKGIEELEKYFEGMPALIFTNESPFKLSKILKKSKSKAPAKPGQIAPNDIVVNKGPTPFAPGPIISELSSVGLKVGVESGKVAVKEDTVIVKKGEKIKPKVAEILSRLDIKPMEIGLGLVAAYEDGIIYQKDILDVDEEQYNNNINLAASQAFNLAFNITYVTKDNISFLIGKAFNDTKALGISQEILDKGIIEDLLGKAEMSMLSLKNNAKIETKIQIVKEKPETQEKPKETEKPPVKEEIKKELQEEKVGEKKEIEEKPVEIKKEEPKLQVKVEKPKEDVDKKVSKMVERTKKFIEGTEETAADILEDVKKEEVQEEKKQRVEEQKQEEKVPSAYDLKEKKDEAKIEDKEAKQEKEHKEVEDLTKELIKKGTLRKNKQ
ncbi:MAG: 50S ribosomal protein L10 [Nanoarchaeota archaeon]|nr:50S ribosomal protein L10 [Nanoarchaeota archaeon]